MSSIPTTFAVGAQRAAACRSRITLAGAIVLGAHGACDQLT